MKISSVTFFAVFLITALNGMQDQPVTGLQVRGSDGHIYDICQTTGITMRSVPAEEINNKTQRTTPGMLQALHDELSNSRDKAGK
jgi:hypothetical protein